MFLVTVPSTSYNRSECSTPKRSRTLTKMSDIVKLYHCYEISPKSCLVLGILWHIKIRKKVPLYFEIIKCVFWGHFFKLLLPPSKLINKIHRSVLATHQPSQKCQVSFFKFQLELGHFQYSIFDLMSVM